ncbi:hypothetical protein BDR07DRAFT_1417547 [Suillus spraguei]|nr:hypothetical protein BDR07DRAFT_1417547 [Suillus spraguei]
MFYILSAAIFVLTPLLRPADTPFVTPQFIIERRAAGRVQTYLQNRCWKMYGFLSLQRQRVLAMPWIFPRSSSPSEVELRRPRTV